MSDPLELDGPRLAPLSGGKARQLVIILHGYGADGADLINLTGAWRELMPDAAFVAPNAPERCAMSPMGYQWFELTFRDPDERWRGVQQAAPGLNVFIDAELARHDLTGEALALVGFSQGTMMALHTGLRRTSLAAIVGYSGLLAGGEHLPGDIKCRPPVLLCHGSHDDVIPVEALEQARRVLGALEVPLRWHVIEGMGHGIDPDSAAMGGEFLRDAFADIY